MFVACGIWCLAGVSSVSPSSEQTALSLSHRRQTYHINLVDQTHIQRTRPRRKTVFFSKLVFEFYYWADTMFHFDLCFGSGITFYPKIIIC